MESWFEVEFLLLKILRLQPDVLDKMEFYRAEILMDNLKEWNEKEQEQRKKEDKEQSSQASSYDSSSMSRQAGSMMKSAGSMVPNMGSFKL